MNEKRAEEVSYLLGLGLNCKEVAKELGIHRVTVNRYKMELKRMYYNMQQEQGKD